MFVGNEFTDLDATFLTKEIEVSINEIQKKEKKENLRLINSMLMFAYSYQTDPSHTGLFRHQSEWLRRHSCTVL